MTITIWERTQTALTGLGLPLAANVLIVASESDRPDAYIVHTLISSPPMLFADDEEKARAYVMQVNYYNRAGLAGMPDIPAAMAAAGFSPSARREIPYNSDTRHFGYAMDFVYVE